MKPKPDHPWRKFKLLPKTPKEEAEFSSYHIKKIEEARKRRQKREHLYKTGMAK